MLDPAIFGDDSAPKKNLCAADGCPNLRVPKRPLCHAHRKRQQRGQPLEAPLKHQIPKSERPRCSVTVCPRAAVTKGYCHAHYVRSMKGGDLQTHVEPRASRGAKVHLAGFAIHKETKAAMRARAKELRVSIATLTTRILDEWAKQFLSDRRSSESRVLDEVGAR